MKKTFYVANQMNDNVLQVKAETIYEAYDKAFAMWDCKIPRSLMYKITRNIPTKHFKICAF
ncbi:MAG: hypothetical protein EOL88_02550 [Bacteroidia bacterium]|nr:hypothetical protein [Bacteroidia bacterium]